jgi:hypothetical protein
MRIAVLALLLGSSACLMGPGNANPNELATNERGVRVFYPGQTPDCRFEQLQTIEATSGSAFEMGAFASTVARLQQETAALGGNAVLILDHSKNRMADQATALALRCVATVL